MKGRLITNGILSLLTTTLFIVMIVLLVKGVKDSIDTGVGSTAVKEVAVGAWIYVVLVILYITSLIMGIVTLSMEKSSSAHGLTIASGILAILGGCFFAGAIVSFLGAAKA